VPVVAQPDRIAGLRTLFETDTHVDCVILDDGFQHRQIARDLDIVLIDASSPPNGDALLPRGYLRDPISSLTRAHAVVITHREMVSDEQLDELVGWIKSKVPGCPVAVASHGWYSAMVYTPDADGWQGQSRGWQGESVPTEQIEPGKVVGVCAIGNPDGFFHSIEQNGWDLVDRLALTDHDPFNDAAISRLAQLIESSNASAVCMTRKDWVKVSDRLPLSARVTVIVPELGLVFESGEESLRALIAELEES
jgi:tetraacyldisaccharide 4'-kinase